MARLLEKYHHRHVGFVAELDNEEREPTVILWAYKNIDKNVFYYDSEDEETQFRIYVRPSEYDRMNLEKIVETFNFGSEFKALMLRTGELNMQTYAKFCLKANQRVNNNLIFKKMLNLTGLHKETEVVIRLFALSAMKVSKSQITNWQRQPSNPACSMMRDDVLNAFFDGLFEYKAMLREQGIDAFGLGKHKE